MMSKEEIVITGIGVVSPIGIGKDAVWTSLLEGCGGVREMDLFRHDDLPIPYGAQVVGFEPKKRVRPRKSLKVMSRDIQLGFAAADLACDDAGLHSRPVDPERLGIVFGADMIHCELDELANAFHGCIVEGQFDFDRWGKMSMAEMYPLWMLKYLPNMPACHIGIAQDARGPNNSLTLGEVSSLSAVAEAVRVIQRGQADVMIAGGTASRINPASWVRSRVPRLSHGDEPSNVSRPFDLRRDGMINGEGAGAMILETRHHAQQRGAEIFARILCCAGGFEPCRNGATLQGRAIRNAVNGALRAAGLEPGDVGHVNANGVSTIADDRIEAQAIRDTLADVPVTAPKSFFGYLGAGSGAVEMIVSIMALQHGLVPQTLNYGDPDPECPVNVVRDEPMRSAKPTALMLNHTPLGQAMAVLAAAAD